MSALDRLNDNELALTTSVLRRLTLALIHAGINPEMFLTREELAVCVKLNGLFPAAGPTDANGEPA